MSKYTITEEAGVVGNDHILEQNITIEYTDERLDDKFLLRLWSDGWQVINNNSVIGEGEGTESADEASSNAWDFIHARLAS